MADTPQSMKKVLGKLGSRKRDADLSNYVFDKLPPQARELEEVVLGGMMLDKDAVAEIIDILKPESFYVDAHQHIFEAIHDLFGKSEPVDILTVTEQLRKMGKLAEVGGPFYVTKLTNRVGSTANIEHHARIISERYILRELIKTSNMVIKEAYEDTTDVFDLLDKAEQNLFSITEQNLRRSYDTMTNLVQQAIKQLENIKDHQDGVVGVPTGYVNLDRLTSGWQKSDLVIIAARPAMGKTALTLNIARNAAVDFGKGVALFSLEMSSLQLVNRLISSETGISSEKLKKGDLRPDEWVELTTKVDKLAEAPIFIDDTPAINIFELRAKCRRLKMQHDIQLIVIDYLQLMSGGGSDTKSSGNREQEISLISRSLKSIAKELDVPVIALSQLSRAVETRGGDKRPQLSDLRECITGDSLIYLPRTRTYKKVKDLVGKQNFEVLSLDENLKLQRAKCLDVWETGKKKVYEVTTSSGFKIKASANHPFLTVEGWKKLEELEEGKSVASFKDEDLEHLTSNVKWEKIKSIKYVGTEPTYDLHVEKHHNFLSNNFIVHNSGAIEQDADIVMFIYRPEYYGLDQDEDGNPTKGITELIVAKHRNGALDTVKLRFIPQFTKFEDFSSLDQSMDGFTPLGEIITRESRMNEGNMGRSDEPLPF